MNRNGNSQEKLTDTPLEFKQIKSGEVVKLMYVDGQPAPHPHFRGQYAYAPASAAETERFLQGGFESYGDVEEIPVDGPVVSEGRVEELRRAEQDALELVEQLRREREREEQRLAEQAEAERQRILEQEEAERQRAVEEYLARRRGESAQSTSKAHSRTESAIVDESELTPSRMTFLRTKRGKAMALTATTAVLGGATWAGLDSAKMNPFNPTEAAADTSLTEFDKSAAISEAAFDVDNCFADDGTGTPLFSGNAAFVGWVNWPVVKTDKSIVNAALANDNPELAPVGKEDAKTRKPVVTVDAVIDYAACVPEADADNFLKVDPNSKTVTVDLSKATPQFAFRQEGIGYKVEQFDLAETKNEAGDVIVTKESAAATVTASQDEAVVASLLDMATAKAAGVIAKADGEYAEQMKAVTDAFTVEITEEINEQAAAFYEESGQPVEKLEVKVDGALKSAMPEYKGVAPKESDKVGLADEALKVTQFNPVTK